MVELARRRPLRLMLLLAAAAAPAAAWRAAPSMSSGLDRRGVLAKVAAGAAAATGIMGLSTGEASCLLPRAPGEQKPQPSPLVVVESAVKSPAH